MTAARSAELLADRPPARGRTGAGGDFGQGPLSQLAGAVYRHAVLGVCLAVACVPTLLVGAALGRGPGAAPWLVLAQLPVAPALAAGLYAVRAWRQDLDTGPLAAFARGLRADVADVLRWWLPTLLALAVLVTNVAVGAAAVGAPALRGVSTVVAVVVLLWSGHTLVISAVMRFRTRDLAVIALLTLVRHWRVTLTMVSLLVVALGVVYVGSEVALALLAWAFVSVLEHVSRPLRADVETRFTAPASPVPA